MDEKCVSDLFIQFKNAYISLIKIAISHNNKTETDVYTYLVNQYPHLKNNKHFNTFFYSFYYIYMHES